MSAGLAYSPDDDDPNKLAPSPFEPAPAPALTAEPPPENPEGVDAITGATPGPEVPPRPPVPGGQLNTDQLMTAATVPPNAGGDAVDREIAANPIPPANQAPATPAKLLTVQEQEAKAQEERDKLLEQEVAAKQKADAARMEQAKTEQAAAAEQARIQQEAAQRQQQIVDQANARTQQWMDAQQEQIAKFQNMGLHDYFEDQPLLNKVLAGLAIFTGAAGGRSAADNPGLQIVNQAVERHYRLQQAAILKQKENVAMAKEGVDSALSTKQQQLADNNLKKASAYDAVAAQAVATKLKQGIPLEQANNDANVIALRKAANDTRMETLKAVHAQNVQDAQLGQGEERIGIERERAGYEKDKLAIEKERADAAMVSAQARAHKGKGGGGGAGGAHAGAAFDAMQKAAEADGANLASVVRAGMAAGMSEKEAAKQGKNIWGDYQKGAGAEKKADAGVEKDVGVRLDKYEQQAVGTARTLGPVRVLSQVEAMRHGLEEAAASGDSDRIKAAATKAKEQAGALMSGGKLTNAQIKILHELESSTDELVSKIGKFTGKPTEGKGAIKRLTTLIDDAGNELVSQIGDIRQRGIDEMLGSGGAASTPEAKRKFLNRNKGLYGQVKWKGQHVFDEKGAEEPPASGGDSPLSQQQAARLIQHLKDQPNDPRADAIKRRLRDAGYAGY